MTGKSPPVPGEVIKREILRRLRIRQADLARATGLSKVTINQLVNGRAPLTAAKAVRLGHATRTAPEYWLSLQSDFDLHRERERLQAELIEIPRISPDRLG